LTSKLGKTDTSAAATVFDASGFNAGQLGHRSGSLDRFRRDVDQNTPGFRSATTASLPAGSMAIGHLELQLGSFSQKNLQPRLPIF
jgi:hypothetical protein